MPKRTKRPVGRPREFVDPVVAGFYLPADLHFKAMEMGGSAFIRGAIAREWDKYQAAAARHGKKNARGTSACLEQEPQEGAAVAYEQEPTAAVSS